MTYSGGYVTFGRDVDGDNAIYKVMTVSYLLDNLLNKDNSPVRWLLGTNNTLWGIICNNVKLPADFGSGLTNTEILYLYEALNGGASEAQAATEGQYAMRQRWQERYQQYEVSGFSNSETADIDSLVVWCMSNERLTYGCDCPTSYVPVPGDLTMPMSWARVGGYNVENERTVMVGQVNGQRASAYDAMLRARDRIFSMIRPGAVFEDLYLAAMEVYQDAGFGDILPGRCGHGMGLSSHEFPSVTKGSKLALAPGMIFTVEPGLMSVQLGAVRHSDTVLVTDAGFEFLTNSPRDQIIIKGK